MELLPAAPWALFGSSVPLFCVWSAFCMSVLFLWPSFKLLVKPFCEIMLGLTFFPWAIVSDCFPLIRVCITLSKCTDARRVIRVGADQNQTDYIFICSAYARYNWVWWDKSTHILPSTILKLLAVITYTALNDQYLRSSKAPNQILRRQKVNISKNARHLGKLPVSSLTPVLIGPPRVPQFEFPSLSCSRQLWLARRHSCAGLIGLTWLKPLYWNSAVALG